MLTKSEASRMKADVQKRLWSDGFGAVPRITKSALHRIIDRFTGKPKGRKRVKSK